MTGLLVSTRGRRAGRALGFIALLTATEGCLAPVAEKDNVVDALVEDSCSMESLRDVGPLDVAIAIDNSFSTRNPSGIDLDGDGIVGKVVESRFTDRDDSKLQVELAAAARLIKLAESADVRFSIVSYSGPSSAPTITPTNRVVLKLDARVHAELTQDVVELAKGLVEIEEHGSKGTSNFVAGLRRATRTLIEGADDERASQKLILFISDSAAPVLRQVDGQDTLKDFRLAEAAHHANDHEVAVNTFGLSEESEKWRLEALGLIAGATGGDYHVVKDPNQLYCHLASALVTASAAP